MEENKNNLTKNQKLALAGLAIFTILIVVLWIFNLIRTWLKKFLLMAWFTLMVIKSYDYRN